jgi:hypothetical protein
MYRTEITAELVAEAERMMAERAQCATIASRLDVTPYVVRLIAGNRHLKSRGQVPQHGPRRLPNTPRGIDAVTIRMVQRMLAVGILPHVAIAREAGVSPTTVNDVARGKRLPISMSNPYLQQGEQFLPIPVRCDVCCAKISVLPCRACQARKDGCAKKSV